MESVHIYVCTYNSTLPPVFSRLPPSSQVYAPPAAILSQCTLHLQLSPSLMYAPLQVSPSQVLAPPAAILLQCMLPCSYLPHRCTLPLLFSLCLSHRCTLPAAISLIGHVTPSIQLVSVSLILYVCALPPIPPVSVTISLICVRSPPIQPEANSLIVNAPCCSGLQLSATQVYALVGIVNSKFNQLIVKKLIQILKR